MKNYLELTQSIREYVTQLFNQYKPINLMYHNLKHTQTVVERTTEISANYPLSEKELFILLAAAWFHDTGHLIGGAKLHEDRSVTIMQKFLETKGTPKEIIDTIEGCICATKLSQEPKSLLEEIICDADTYNLGTKEFLTTDKLLKKEFALRNMPVDNWEEKTLELLQCHTYSTDYCKSLLKAGREKNISLVRNLLKVKNTKRASG